MQTFFDFADNFSKHSFPIPQYLGCKYKHLEWIGNNIPDKVKTVMDAFAGSQSVSYYMKQRGFKVYTNDFMRYSDEIGKSLIENDSETLLKEDIEILFDNNQDTNKYNLMSTTFTNVFFNQEDATFLDSFRSNIDRLKGFKKNLALCVMNRAMTRKVTMGHFAHNKAIEYASNPERIKRNPSLIIPIKELFLKIIPEYNNAVFSNGFSNKSFAMDAIDFIHNNKKGVDLIYFDPPYCDSHADYQSFYHVLETYTEYWKDKKFINTVKCFYPKKKSGFVKKCEIVSSLQKLFEEASSVKYWIISYNDRSYPKLEDMLKIISDYKKVKVVEKEYLNNVGGKGSVKGSKELLFVCS